MSIILADMKPAISVNFDKRDVWVGFYWIYLKSVVSAYRRFVIYVCLIPMLPIRFEWAWGWR